MPKLPAPFDRHAFAISSILDEGRVEDAKTELVKHLRAGTAGRQVQAIAAELLKPTRKKKRGGQSVEYPAFWIEIARAYHTAVDGGLSQLEARETVGERFGYSATHVRTCVRLFDSALAEDGAE